MHHADATDEIHFAAGRCRGNKKTDAYAASVFIYMPSTFFVHSLSFGEVMSEQSAHTREVLRLQALTF
jgi:hypothetical protein